MRYYGKTKANKLTPPPEGVAPGASAVKDQLSDEVIDGILHTYEGPEYAVLHLAREVKKRRAIEAKLRELHVEGTRLNAHFCVICTDWYPCPTIRLLDGE